MWIRSSIPLALVAVATILCGGCDGRPNQVHFVLPDGFEGPFAIEPDPKDGAELTKVDGRYVVNIPKESVLKMKGYNPFVSYLNTAAFVGGRPIWVEKKLGDKPGVDEPGLWGVGTKVEYPDGVTPTNERYYWFVGTEAKWKASAGDARYKIGGVVKKE
jgi:hypothetical protein